jgi:citronellol/citronellal dehydrogenase
MNLNNKTILITGASRGIGRAIALRCAQDGARIVIASKTSDPHPVLPGTIHTVAEEVVAAGGEALALAVDVRDEAAIAGAVAAAVERFGTIDALVNNAGAISLTDTASTAMKRYDLMMAVNVRATFACSQACLPHLKTSGGHILNLSPPIDLNPRWLAPHVAYTMSKFGMSMCTRGMAAEFAPHGIAVNSLWPRTLIATDALRAIGGMDLARGGRTTGIMGEAAYALLTTPPADRTGEWLIDEDVLTERGITDLEQWRVDPDTPLIQDLFLGD